MAKTWIIEQAKPTDANEIQKLLRTVWLETYPNKEYNVTIIDIESKKFLSKEIIKKRRDILKTKNIKRVDYIARQNGEIIGWCAAEKKKNFGQIMTIYIHPAHQGHGLGKTFISKSFDWLGNQKLIIVEVAIYNKKAIGFYKKIGFKDIKIRSEYKFPNGKTIPTVVLVMRRK